MVTVKACLFSLGEELDWIKEDLGNRLVRQRIQRKPTKAWEVDWLV